MHDDDRDILDLLPLELLFVAPSVQVAARFGGVLQRYGFVVEVDSKMVKAVCGHQFIDHERMIHDLARATHAQYCGFRIFSGNLIDLVEETTDDD